MSKTMPNSLFHEEDHPRGQPSNSGEFAPKGGGAKPATKSLFDDDDRAGVVSAFEAAFSKPWQPKLFDADPSGQKSLFDAGIEKGHGKKVAAQKPKVTPSLVEQIEEALSRKSAESRPLSSQKAMFSRSKERYQKAWQESEHPRDANGRFAEGHAQAHVASGKAFREWTSRHAVPLLVDRGYYPVEAQQVAFKAAQRVHRREKGEPIESAVKDAVDILNHWADKKGPPQPPPIGETAANITETDKAIAETPQDITKPAENISPEASIPEAPEWFNRLKEALEQRRSAPVENPDRVDSEPGQPVSESNGDDIHFKEWTPDDGVKSAPPPVVAKLPDAVEPLSPLRQTPGGGLIGSTQMHVGDLKADPKRFQYKFVGVGENGVTKELKDAKRFNPMLGGQLLVWQDPADRQTYVINGHHRFDLAKRSLADGSDDWNGILSVYFIEADTPATARALGAVTNIAEGRGTVVDAAKFLRDTNADLAQLEEHGVSVKGAMARDAIPLSKLSPRIWQKVAQETVTSARGLAIAKHLGADHDAQDQLFSIIEQREQKTGKDIPDSHVEEMAREMSMTPKHQESGGLFGDFFERSLLPERAGLKAAVRRAISAEQNAFAAVSTTRRAGTLQSEGKNTLDTEGNRDKAKQAARQLEDFEQQSNWAGNPIAAAINEAAQRLANEPRKAKSIEKQLVDQVRGLLTGSAIDGDDQLGSDRQPVAVADATGSRPGQPERHSRQSAARTLTALFEAALMRQRA